MDTVNAYMAKFDRQVDSILIQVTRPKIVSAILYVLVHTALILYVTQFAGMLPPSVLKMLSNDFFKLFMLSLVLWTAQFSPSISIMVALAFIVTVNYSTTGKYWEMMENIPTQSVEVPVAVPTLPSGLSASDSVDNALATAATAIQTQVQQAPIVAGVTQSEQTITVTPSIIQTQQGPIVVNPSVVVAPVVVSTPQGETVSVSPSVQTVSVSAETQAPAVAAPVVAAPVITEAAPAITEAAPAITAAAEPASYNQTGCFPIRQADMSQVLGTSDQGVGVISDYATFTKL